MRDETRRACALNRRSKRAFLFLEIVAGGLGVNLERLSDFPIRYIYSTAVLKNEVYFRDLV